MMFSKMGDQMLKHLKVLVISSALLSPGMALAQQAGELNCAFGLAVLNNASSTVNNVLTSTPGFPPGLAPQVSGTFQQATFTLQNACTAIASTPQPMSATGANR